jgi:hypothetical protein
MQLVGTQFVPGSTVTVKKVVAELPHWSVAVAMTGVVVLTGKQVVTGGLNVIVGLGWTAQQVSEAVTLYATVVQLLQV